MASKGCSRFLRQINGLSRHGKSSAVGPQCQRSMATVSEAPLPSNTTTASTIVTSPFEPSSSPSTFELDPAPFEQPPQSVLTTIYSFPRMEPLQFAYYPENHLYLPLRKDLLHRAVIYEGDKTRQGTASTKWRNEVHGSHKKLYQQKGTGKARVGDKQSPIRRGGGVAFGPKPRDFATKLNRKIYDIAWRTALSFRYRKGELVVVDRIRNLKIPEPHWLKQVFHYNRWGNADKRSLLVTEEIRSDNKSLARCLEDTGDEGKLRTLEDVDVKDLLGMGRVIIEYEALNAMLARHRSDLVKPSSILGSATDTVLEEDVEGAEATLV